RVSEVIHSAKSYPQAAGCVRTRRRHPSTSTCLTIIVKLVDQQLFPQKPLNTLAHIARIVLAMTGGAASQDCLLPNGPPFLQNYSNVILRGEGGASLHPLAGE